MNESEDQNLKKLLKANSPPPVSSSEWGDVWKAIQGSLHSKVVQSRESTWISRWAYAVTLLFGIGIGLALSGWVRNQPERPNPKNDVQVPIQETMLTPEQQLQPLLTTEQVEGIDLFGLKNVTIEEKSPEIMGTTIYQMSGETPNGIKVVWNYREQESRNSNSGGRL